MAILITSKMDGNFFLNKFAAKAQILSQATISALERALESYLLKTDINIKKPCVLETVDVH